jgi:photosystem II stability/assembly factor-like uncharacterized protein
VLLRIGVFLICIVGLVQPCAAHDPSTWGGTFRSRDGGATWMPVDAGLFVGGAITVAIDPLDANHLLYATDTRLLRSRNGGRDWVQEPSPVFIGPTLAVAFARDGKAVLAATAAGVFVSESGGQWKPVNLSPSATPALAILAGVQPSQFYVVGAHGSYRSDDHGLHWVRIGEALPAAPVAMAVPVDSPHSLVAIVQGSLYASTDDGASWQARAAGLPDGHLEMVATDVAARRVWAGGAGRLFRSDDGGSSWVSVGQGLPDPDTQMRGVIASEDGNMLSVSTHRGLYRSADGAQTWQQEQGNLPVHLEAGALIRDPHAAATLYVPFSLTPYHEIRRRALEGSNLLSQVDPISLLGAAAFFILFVVAAAYLVRKLMKISSRSTSSTGIS